MKKSRYDLLNLRPKRRRSYSDVIQKMPSSHDKEETFNLNII